MCYVLVCYVCVTMHLCVVQGFCLLVRLSRMNRPALVQSLMENTFHIMMVYDLNTTELEEILSYCQVKDNVEALPIPQKVGYMCSSSLCLVFDVIYDCDVVVCCLGLFFDELFNSFILFFGDKQRGY